MRHHGLGHWLWLLTICLGLAGCGSGDAPPNEPEAAASSATRSVASASMARRAPKPIDLTNLELLIRTTMGDIRVRLDGERAPLTVRNFLDYADAGHYNGTVFHQVVEDYIVLGGGYTADLVEKPTQQPIRNEAHNGLSNRRGTIAMARSYDAIDSSTCQFFINLTDNPMLDHRGDTAEEYGYCVFGEVTSGLEVVEAISRVATRDVDTFELLPVEPVVIRSVELIR